MTFFKLSRSYQYILEYQEPPMGYCSRDYKEIKKHFELNENENIT